MLVVGKREAENGGVAVRRLGVEKQEVLALDEAVNRLKAEAASPAGPHQNIGRFNNKEYDLSQIPDGCRAVPRRTAHQYPDLRADGPPGQGGWHDGGVTPIREALAMAADAGLDLVEISPNAEPPVCKILDFGKFKYEIQKKRNERARSRR